MRAVLKLGLSITRHCLVFRHKNVILDSTAAKKASKYEFRASPDEIFVRQLRVTLRHSHESAPSSLAASRTQQLGWRKARLAPAFEIERAAGRARQVSTRPTPRQPLDRVLRLALQPAQKARSHP